MSGFVNGQTGDAPAGSVPNDVLIVADKAFRSRLFLGTGKYASNRIMAEALAASGTELVTVSVRYMNVEAPEQESLLDYIDRSRYHLLPNTAGATTVKQAVRMAHLAREVTGTHWIKLEVVGDSRTLWPDTAMTVEATRILVEDGFVVLPYTSPDLVAALRLEEAGAAAVMPLGSPIGTGQGLLDWVGITRIIERVSVPVVVDAGLGAPSHAAQAMELGAAAVLINTAIAQARDPVLMAHAMRQGVEAGRAAYLAGRMRPRQEASPSSPTEGIIRERAPRATQVRENTGAELG
ncbi:MAG: thiazole synthase [Firmicutes bacterium]|nr:thiazole synthase [Bacillota bacterium]